MRRAKCGVQNAAYKMHHTKCGVQNAANKMLERFCVPAVVNGTIACEASPVSVMNLVNAFCRANDLPEFRHPKNIAKVVNHALVKQGSMNLLKAVRSGHTKVTGWNVDTVAFSKALGVQPDAP